MLGREMAASQVLEHSGSMMALPMWEERKVKLHAVLAAAEEERSQLVAKGRKG
jgi:hypothetical protein